MITLKHLIVIQPKNLRKKYKEFYGKCKTDYPHKNTYVYTQVVLVPASSMEQLKCTKYLKMTQSMNFQYGQLFQTLELRHTICQST